MIFDMDGLLIDTEPVWRRAEIEIFGRLGLHLTEQQCMETMGVRVPDVVELWYQRHPWIGPSTAQVTEQIIQSVVDYVASEGEPMAGVLDALESVHRAGLPIAIASSSHEALIWAVVKRLGIERYLSLVCSGEDEAEGKPHPAVYLTTAKRLGIDPEYCLALEDSPNGVLAAKAAGMMCIAVPDPHLSADPRMNRADIHLKSLLEFTPALLASLMEDDGGVRRGA
ncbi:MAG: hexitol phosphatase HxpB [Gemmatimonadaceae bacterium]